MLPQISYKYVEFLIQWKCTPLDYENCLKSPWNTFILAYLMETPNNGNHQSKWKLLFFYWEVYLCVWFHEDAMLCLLVTALHFYFKFSEQWMNSMIQILRHFLQQKILPRWILSITHDFVVLMIHYFHL